LSEAERSGEAGGDLDLRQKPLRGALKKHYIVVPSGGGDDC
jgi:hypothetical protein